ncbi:Nramp family divalent metal transporter [Arthrobacter sp. Soc17.1.1.1]|uniref:Nramp family divalent metal transporter n=1 Tax=Arthrobacter sp. Soc17.1.1.1 TaxID=3121277 RepID=UPI002FE44282
MFRQHSAPISSEESLEAGPAPEVPLRGGRTIWLLGPALVAGVAYLDPGNVASNMTAGALYGFLLVWVVVLGNVMAWLVQYLSAKLGIVTGKSLPEILGERISSRWARRGFWLQAELVAMATDIAEILGGAIALNILFDLPLVVGGLITGAVSLAVLQLQGHGRHQVFERLIISMMFIVAIGFSAGVFLSPPEPTDVAAGLLPAFDGSQSVLLAASILGATIMPHAIYAHSALARDRFPRRPQTAVPRLLSATRWDVTIALTIAGAVNLAILLLAATSLQGRDDTGTLEGAHGAIAEVLGPVIATLFAIGLLASGLASSSVGAYAGAEIMHGLLRVKIPLGTRRIITLIPALLILAFGVDPTQALILSQVVLSFGISFALIPLVYLGTRADIMGDHQDRWWTTLIGAVVAALLVTLNLTLLYLVFTGSG